MKNKKLIPYFILFIHILLLIIYFIYGYIGHYGYDDLHYAKLANNLNNGIIDYDDHFTYRFPVILLTALSYSVFGISDFASALPTIIVTIFILILVFHILKHKGNFTLSVGLSLTLFSHWFIFYSNKLMPDIYVVFAVVFALFVLYKYKFSSSKWHPALYAFLFAIALLIGFMAKGSIVLILPLLIYFVIVDLVIKRDVKFWLYSLISGILVLSLYFIVIWMLTGDFAKRFDAIIGNSYLNACSYDKQSIIILLRRIFYDFAKMMTYQGMLTGFIFVIPVFLKKEARSYFKFNDSFSFFLISSLILFLSSNFMTISPTSYVPMCIDPRHYLFLIPIVAVPASISITEFVREKKYHIFLIITLIIVAFLSYYLEGNSCRRLYLPLTILFVLLYFIKPNKIFEIAFAFLFMLILAIKPWYMIKYAQNIKYWKQREVVQNYVLNIDKECYVITNEVQRRLCNYYNGFDNNSNLEFLSYYKFNLDTLDDRRVLLLMNWYPRYLSGFDKNDLPYYAKKIDSSNTLIYESKELKMSIYELNKINIPSLSGITLLQTFNDFEGMIPDWDQNNSDLTDQLSYEGNKSIKVNEHSSTFSFAIDSLPIKDYDNILISSEVYCNFIDKTNSKLMVTLEDENGVYSRNGLRIDKYLKAYSNWWPVKYDVEILTNEINESSVLKIHIWNPGKIEGYIDNFSIKIIGIEKD